MPIDYILLRGTMVSMGIVTLFVVTTGLASSQSGDLTEHFPSNVKTDWATGAVTARGNGIPPINHASAGQAKEMARKAAWTAALRNLLKAINGVQIDSNTRVIDYVAANDELRTKVERFVRGARIVQEQEMLNGSFETTVEMRLDGKFMATFIPKVIPLNAPLAKYKKGSGRIPKSYTGLIVDARYLGASPALAPRLLNEQGEEAYSIAYVEQRVKEGHKIVLYAADLKSAKTNQLVAGNPLIVRALRAQGMQKTDLVISDADTATIHGAPEHFKFLKQAKVVFIIEPSQ